MTYLIPKFMLEQWEKFAEAVINSENKESTLSNTMELPKKEFYIELKIKRVKDER